MTHLLRAGLVALLLLCGVDSARAQDAEPDPMALLKKFAEALSSAERFRYIAQTGFDVVQDNGQKIEFGATREVSVRRPDRSHAFIVRRDGNKTEFFYDGEQATLLERDENVYAQAVVPGTLEGALDYLTTKVGVPSPLAELVDPKLWDELTVAIESSVYVDTVTLGRRSCHHLAFRQQNIDWQLFVETDARSLPCRIVITYKLEEDSPQFRADFLEWDLAPEVPDSMFVFTKPEGSQQIPLVAVSPIERDIE
jgi:hypothetical protein